MSFPGVGFSLHRSCTVHICAFHSKVFDISLMSQNGQTFDRLDCVLHCVGCRISGRLDLAERTSRVKVLNIFEPVLTVQWSEPPTITHCG